MIKIKTKPSTIIRQNYNNFSKYCHSINEPITITLNGKPDLIIMSYEVYESIQGSKSYKENSNISPQNNTNDDSDLFL